ncbi:MAG: phage tail protein [Rhodobacteraceae bacterium]|nr:phage tail protein [Paracoccaceae bacterium]
MPEDFGVVEKTIRQQKTKYYGKYRAFVVDNEDPEGLGRVTLKIPSVLGEEDSDWALPCTPYGGACDLGFLMVPPPDAQVVAEFLEGDPSSPMWTGTFWRKQDELPAEYTDGEGPKIKVLKTDSGHFLTFQDKEGEEQITLKAATEAEMILDPDGSIILTDQAGAKVTLDAAGSELLVEDANGNSIVMSSTGITCTDASGNEIKTAGSGVDIKSSAVVNVEGSMVTIAGSGGEPLVKGTTFMTMFNTHTHVSPVGPTSPPVVPLTPAALTMKSTAQ